MGQLKRKVQEYDTVGLESPWNLIPEAMSQQFRRDCSKG